MKNYENLNVYLSNLAVLNIKLHNIHWNVEGKQFVQVHEFTEGLYDDFFAKFDAVAELMKMRGVTPLSKIADYLAHASVKECEQTKFAIEESLKIVKGDLELMRDLAIKIRNEADEASDFVVVGEFEDHVAGYDKNIWFIESILA